MHVLVIDLGLHCSDASDTESQYAGPTSTGAAQSLRSALDESSRRVKLHRLNRVSDLSPTDMSLYSGIVSTRKLQQSRWNPTRHPLTIAPLSWRSIETGSTPGR